jgi:hypothetical protein
MFSNLTINPVSSAEFAGRMALAIVCAATMFTLAVSPAMAANQAAISETSCRAISAQASTFARVQMGVAKAC